MNSNIKRHNWVNCGRLLMPVAMCKAPWAVPRTKGRRGKSLHVLGSRDISLRFLGHGRSAGRKKSYLAVRLTPGGPGFGSQLTPPTKVRGTLRMGESGSIGISRGGKNIKKQQFACFFFEGKNIFFCVFLKQKFCGGFATI